jgi:hypothetical protein
MKDGRPFTFAGLWENWKDPESEEWLRTYTIKVKHALAPGVWRWLLWTVTERNRYGA